MFMVWNRRHTLGVKKNGKRCWSAWSRVGLFILKMDEGRQFQVKKFIV
jgi:hypothetical protein